MKQCFKCKKKKRLSEFYKHPMMGDGHLGKCKECAKRDVKSRTDKLKVNPEYIKGERARGREKYYRLGYREKRKVSGPASVKAMAEYRKRYPEKRRATGAASNIPCPKGLHRHHWSYNPAHWLDVLFLTQRDHSKLHRYMTYDPERMMYRTYTGVLLDAREKHEAFFASLVNQP